MSSALPFKPTAVDPPTHSSEVAARFAYSYGVQHQQIVWISGQVALRDGAIVGVDDIERQTETVFENLDSVMKAVGGTLDDLVETTTYATDRSHLATINEVRVRRLTGTTKPTSTLLVVAGLARPEFLVEISAVAVLNGERGENR